MKLLPSLTLLVGVFANGALADILVPARTIRAQSILTTADFVVAQGTIAGAFTDPAEIEGMEARVTLYAGRPVRPGDVGPAAIIERNQIVTLFYMQNGLRIATEARALSRAGPGDRLRVMNLASRATVSGTVDRHGRVVVGVSNDLMADLEKN